MFANDEHVTVETREEAIRALLAMRDDEGILALRIHPVSAALAVPYLETLHRLRDPRGESPALRYLKGAARASAVDTLAAIGTRESVPHLRALLEGRISAEERVGVEVAIELIQERITGRSGAGHGAISVVADSDKAGALSTAAGGELSNSKD